MLASKGLTLGQFATTKAEPEPTFEPEFMSPDEQGCSTGRLPISPLVRARKCMIRLGLNTIGDLVRRTGDDLLECKNFGVTSLNEVREKSRFRTSSCVATDAVRGASPPKARRVATGRFYPARFIVETRARSPNLNFNLSSPCPPLRSPSKFTRSIAAARRQRASFTRRTAASTCRRSCPSERKAR